MRYIVAGVCLVMASLAPARMYREKHSGMAFVQNSPASTQAKASPIPDKFVNLQVLPKDISKPQLMTVMKQFSITFGVRCSYCHTVSDDLSQGAFDSDDKEPKLKARELIKALLEMSPHGPAK